MLDNEPNKFRQENFPPKVNYQEQQQLLSNAVVYFTNIKSIFLDLEHSKDYSTETYAMQKENLKKAHYKSLGKLFHEFNRFNLIVKFFEGNIFNSQAELLFKQLHRVVLRFEKMPTRNLNYQKVVRELLEPIMNYLRDMTGLAETNLRIENLPKRENDF